ncbi:MAG: hypothetical protein D6753_14670 [Planctomycetota bacterium]|nr:MAG: hypothetical protein D6753_14670 [Planctomycetota bacterium]
MEHSSADASKPLEAEVIHLGGAVDALKLGIAVQWAPRRWRKALQDMQQRVQRGETLDAAYRAAARRMPAEMQSLWQEAFQTNDPCGLVQSALQVRMRQGIYWRQLVGTLAYPLSLLYATIIVAVGFNYALSVGVDLSWVAELGVDGFDRIQAAAADQLAAVQAVGVFALWLLVIAAAVRWLGPRWAWLAVAGGVAYVGAPLRYLAFSSLLRRILVFIQSGAGEGQAITAAARSLRGSELEMVGRGLQARLTHGLSLGNALAESLLADRITRPILRTLDHAPGEMGPAIESAADLLDRMGDMQCRMIRRILTPLVIISVPVLLFSTFATYLNLLLRFLNLLVAWT